MRKADKIYIARKPIPFKLSVIRGVIHIFRNCFGYGQNITYKIGSEEVLEYQENSSNLYRFHYLKEQKNINQNMHFKKNRQTQIEQLHLKQPKSTSYQLICCQITLEISQYCGVKCQHAATISDNVAETVPKIFVQPNTSYVGVQHKKKLFCI